MYFNPPKHSRIDTIASMALDTIDKTDRIKDYMIEKTKRDKQKIKEEKQQKAIDESTKNFKEDIFMAEIPENRQKELKNIPNTEHMRLSNKAEQKAENEQKLIDLRQGRTEELLNLPEKSQIDILQKIKENYENKLQSLKNKMQEELDRLPELHNIDLDDQIKKSYKKKVKNIKRDMKNELDDISGLNPNFEDLDEFKDLYEQTLHFTEIQDINDTSEIVKNHNKIVEEIEWALNKLNEETGNPNASEEAIRTEKEVRDENARDTGTKFEDWIIHNPSIVKIKITEPILNSNDNTNPIYYRRDGKGLVIIQTPIGNGEFTEKEAREYSLYDLYENKPNGPIIEAKCKSLIKFYEKKTDTYESGINAKQTIKYRQGFQSDIPLIKNPIESIFKDEYGNKIPKEYMPKDKEGNIIIEKPSNRNFRKQKVLVSEGEHPLIKTYKILPNKTYTDISIIRNSINDPQYEAYKFIPTSYYLMQKENKEYPLQNTKLEGKNQNDEAYFVKTTSGQYRLYNIWTDLERIGGGVGWQYINNDGTPVEGLRKIIILVLMLEGVYRYDMTGDVDLEFEIATGHGIKPRPIHSLKGHQLYTLKTYQSNFRKMPESPGGTHNCYGISLNKLTKVIKN